MNKILEKRAFIKRILVLVILPLLWGQCIYFTQKPVDTRSRDGVEITMEEPLGNWRFDAALAEDCPEEAESIRANASGDKVYAVRTAYFHRVVMRQSLYALLVVLGVVLFHDGVTLILKKRGKTC